LVLQSYSSKTSATVTTNIETGTYTDDFADALGIVTNAGARVNTVTGKVQLLKEGSTTLFTTPYRLTGAVTTKTIGDYLGFSAVEWGTISAQTTIPEGTSIKVQVLDSASGLFPDTVLAGNSTGFDLSSPVDISALPMTKHNGGGKIGKIRLKFILTTNSTTVTPLIDSINFTWTTRQGDLSATTVSGSPWGFYGSPKPNGLLSSDYANNSVYSTPRWTNLYERNSMISTRIIYNDLVVYHTWSSNPKLVAADRRTGETVWEIPFSDTIGQFVTGENGTLYAYTITADMAMAIDLTDGSFKWTFQSQNFPHGAGIALGADGTIYYILVKTSAPYDMTLFALNPDGTEKFRQMIDNTVSSPGPIVQGIDGTLYVLSNSKLFAINPTDGSTKWVYEAGPFALNSLTIGNDNILYFSDYTIADKENPKKIYAIDGDTGTPKWVYESGPGINGFQDMIQINDKLYFKSYSYELNGFEILSVTTSMLEVSSENGVLIKTVDSISDISPKFVDAKNNIYYSKVTDSGNNLFNNYFGYMNMDTFEERWKFNTFYSTTDELNRNVVLSKSREMIDEDGWVYLALGKTVSTGNLFDYVSYPDEQWVKYMAMAPWTIIGSSDDSTYSAGETVNFSVTTSMLQTDPLEKTENSVQIYLDNSIKIPLAYSSTNDSGDTVWTGSYALPSDATVGAHTYVAEASSTNIETDITTHFETEATGTNNTGIVYNGSFVVQNALIISDSSSNATNIISSPVANILRSVSSSQPANAQSDDPQTAESISDLAGDPIENLIEIPEISNQIVQKDQSSNESNNYPIYILGSLAIVMGSYLFLRSRKRLL